MLGLYVDATKIGYYRSVQPLRQIVTFVSGSFGFLFLPLASKYYKSDDFDRLSQLYVVSTKWIVSLTLPFVLVFVLFSESVIVVFLGPTYRPASLVLSVLIGGLFLRALVGLDTDFLKAINRTKIELIYASAGVAANIILNFVFISRYGITGAAVATISSFAVYNVLEVAIIYNIAGVHPFARNTILPILPTTAIAITVSLLVNSTLLNLYLLIGVGILFTIIHFISLVITGSFDGNDLILFEQIESRIGRKIPYIRALVH
jgi:O-antigen/teichoic acid export membrane protein